MPSRIGFHRSAGLKLLFSDGAPMLPDLSYMMTRLAGVSRVSAAELAQAAKAPFGPSGSSEKVPSGSALLLPLPLPLFLSLPKVESPSLPQASTETPRANVNESRTGNRRRWVMVPLKMHRRCRQRRSGGSRNLQGLPVGHG